MAVGWQREPLQIRRADNIKGGSAIGKGLFRVLARTGYRIRRLPGRVGDVEAGTLPGK
jgi:hypothetical protein